MKDGHFLGEKNQYNETAISKMSPEILKKILMQKIQREQQGFTVNFDFLRRPVADSTVSKIT